MTRWIKDLSSQQSLLIIPHVRCKGEAHVDRRIAGQNTGLSVPVADAAYHPPAAAGAQPAAGETSTRIVAGTVGQPDEGQRQDRPPQCGAVCPVVSALQQG